MWRVHMPKASPNTLEQVGDDQAFNRKTAEKNLSFFLDSARKKWPLRGSQSAELNHRDHRDHRGCFLCALGDLCG